MNSPSLYTNTPAAPVTNLPNVPVESTSSDMPFNQVFNDSILKSNLNLGQSNPAAATSSLAKPSLSMINFLKTSFLGKIIPVTNDQNQIIQTARVLNIVQGKDKSHYVALLRDTRSREEFEAALVFITNPLGQSYKSVSNPNRPLQVKANMEQRIDESISPLVNSETGSTYTPLTIPDLPDENQAGEGESLEYYDQKLGSLVTGPIVIVKGHPYLRDEGIPMSLKAERVSE